MKWILHDWDDEACARILTSCRRAIVPRLKLLLIETVVPAPGVPHHSKLDDIEMMVLLGSHERTEEEYAALWPGPVSGSPESSGRRRSSAT
jgi:hypothetical protein